MKLKDAIKAIPPNTKVQVWRKNSAGDFITLCNGTPKGNVATFDSYKDKRVAKLVAVGYGKISITVE